MITFCLTLFDRRNCYFLTKSMKTILLRPFYLSLLIANRAGIWTERYAGQEESCPVLLRKEIEDENPEPYNSYTDGNLVQSTLFVEKHNTSKL